jgi:methylphosphotriester-DNA--protein-cysteine methyltransferase
MFGLLQSRAVFHVWSRAGVAETDAPARFAAITSTGVFGRLTCSSGKRALEKHRIFFATYEDAITAGYRPCLTCSPQTDDQYERRAEGWVLVRPTAKRSGE